MTDNENKQRRIDDRLPGQPLVWDEESAQEQIVSLHRQLAAEKLRADQGWERAEAKSRECIELRERLAAAGSSHSETAHLMASPANAAHLAKSIEQARKGEATPRGLIDAAVSAQQVPGELAIAVPAEVRAALDRMCQPLHESRLSGATAAADARCMDIIKRFIDGLAEAPATAGQSQQGDEQ